MDKTYQRKVSRQVILAGQLLLQHGAESMIIGTLCCRLGEALGLDSVEVSLSASSMVVTTLVDDYCITTARRCPDRGVNMHVVSEVQKLVIDVERGGYDVVAVKEKLEAITPFKYNRWWVIIMIGLSCASFCRLSGGDWPLFGWTFLASAIGMFVRQEFTARHFNPLLVFMVTSFVTTLVAAQAQILGIGNTPFLAMACSVLMLVPGVPLINSVSDLVKGYISMGIARGVVAGLLSMATCIGIIAAATAVGVWGWI